MLIISAIIQRGYQETKTNRQNTSRGKCTLNFVYAQTHQLLNFKQSIELPHHNIDNTNNFFSEAHLKISSHPPASIEKTKP